MSLKHGATPTFIEFKNSSNQTVASINTNGDINVTGSVKVNGTTVGGTTLTSLDDVPGVTAPSPSSGDFLKWNGSAWVNDPINLGTDTTGNYISGVSAGTGISITHTPGEGSTPSFSASDASSTSQGVLYGKTTGSTTYQVYLGYEAGSSSVSSSYNIAIGRLSLNSISGGSSNVAIGYNALRYQAFNNYSVAIGHEAGMNAGGSSNIAIGQGALRATSGSSGFENIAIGANALYNTSFGSSNIAIGQSALRSVTSGDYNVVLGGNAGYNLNNGSGNISIGYSSLWSNTSGNYNITLGYAAGYGNTSGSDNIFIGRQAGNSNLSGQKNVFIGYQAGYNETGSDKLYISNSNTSSPLIKGDFASSTVEINGELSYRQGFSNQGINTMVYLTSSDKGKVVTFNTSSNVTVYVNTFANLVAGERIDLLNLGTGTVSISGSGVTINGTPGLKLRAQYSAGSLLCLSSNSTYVLIGDLAV